ncbi:MAG: Ig-like domain-containing protein [Tahibacter sp.]
MATPSFFSLIVAVVLALLVPPAQAVPGGLDCTFGNSGIANLPGTPVMYEMATQGDQLVTVSGSGGFVRLMRFRSNGALDTSFGIAGTTLQAIPGVSFAGSIAIDGAGRIVIAAQYANPDSQVLVARFSADGALDTNFGGGMGWTSFDFTPATVGAGIDRALALTIDSQNRPVVGGVVDPNGNIGNPSNANMAVARLTVDGNLDLTFGSGGIALASSPGNLDEDLRALRIDGAGRIIGIGSTNYPNPTNNGPRNTILARWTATGALDTSFATTGVLILDMSQNSSDDFGIDVTLDSLGRIVALGQGTDDPLLARLNVNGTLDPSFGGTGIVQRSFVGGQDVVEHVLAQPDEKILVTGWPIIGGNFHVASMRFTTSGLLDTSWGGNGVVTTSLGFNERAYAAVLQTDQKLVIAGGADGDSRLFMIRYLNGAATPLATTTMIGSDTPNPSAHGQLVSVTYNTTVDAPPALPTPPGNVTISDGTDSCTGAALDGSCVLVLHGGGNHVLTASYAGNSCYAASGSAGIPHVVKYRVTPTASSGGAISPSATQDVVPGATAAFSISPAAGYRIGSVTGCGGVLAGTAYTTAAIQADCSINAVFIQNPQVQNGSLNVLEDQLSTGSLIGSGAGPLTYLLVQDATHGHVVITDSATGAYQYTPVADANGSDTFTFKVNDGNVDSDIATINITIGPVNDRPALNFGADPSHPAAANGIVSIAAFAQFDAGPADEDASQSVSAYLIDSIADPSGVLMPGSLSINSAGTLDYELSGTGGVATISARVRDNGGTANGGVDTSFAKSFGIHVAPGADLQVSLSNQRRDVTVGRRTTYAIVVRNAGPNAVTGAVLGDPLPASLLDGDWTCRQALSNTPCPVQTSGSGNLATALDLPVNGELRFDVGATVAANAGNIVVNTVSVVAPVGTTALDSADDSATDTDPIIFDRIFEDGVEIELP